MSLRSRWLSTMVAGCLLFAAPAHAQLYFGGSPANTGFASWINNPFNEIDQVVFDNFEVAAGEQWNVTGVFGHFTGFPAGRDLQWEIRTGVQVGVSAGTVVASGAGAATQVGSELSLGVSPLQLGAGTYWLGLYFDLTGIGQNETTPGVWNTDGTGAINAPGDGAAAWILDFNNQTFVNAFNFDFAYGIRGTSEPVGVPEPASAMLLALGALTLSLRALRRVG